MAVAMSSVATLTGVPAISKRVRFRTSATSFTVPVLLTCLSGAGWQAGIYGGQFLESASSRVARIFWQTGETKAVPGDAASQKSTYLTEIRKRQQSKEQTFPAIHRGKKSASHAASESCG